MDPFTQQERDRADDRAEHRRRWAAYKTAAAADNKSHRTPTTTKAHTKAFEAAIAGPWDDDEE